MFNILLTEWLPVVVWSALVQKDLSTSWHLCLCSSGNHCQDNLVCPCSESFLSLLAFLPLLLGSCLCLMSLHHLVPLPLSFMRSLPGQFGKTLLRRFLMLPTWSRTPNLSFWTVPCPCSENSSSPSAPLLLSFS